MKLYAQAELLILCTGFKVSSISMYKFNFSQSCLFSTEKAFPTYRNFMHLLLHFYKHGMYLGP